MVYRTNMSLLSSLVYISNNGLGMKQAGNKRRCVQHKEVDIKASECTVYSIRKQDELPKHSFLIYVLS